MNRLFRMDKRIVSICICVVLSICAILVFYQLISNSAPIYKSAVQFLGSFLNTCKPIIFGIVIAYLLHKPCKTTGRWLSKLKPLKNRPNVCVVLGVLIVNIVALGLVILFCYAVIPSTVYSISQIIARSNEATEMFQNLFSKLLDSEQLKWLLQQIDPTAASLNDITQSELFKDVFSYGRTLLENFGSSLFGTIMDTGKFLYNFIFGFITAIYINLDIRNLKRQLSRLLRAVMPKKHHAVMSFLHLSDEIFFKYLIGKAVCSAIIGVLTFAACALLKVQYALLIAIIVCVTNMIPTFGPIIGAFPAMIFAMLSGFDAVVEVLVIIIIVQQIDGNILAPKIIGDIVNLSGFWILVSIIVCGHFMGLFGMIIGIPLFAVIRILCSRWLNRREAALREQDELPPAPMNEEDYAPDKTEESAEHNNSL